MNKGRLLIIGLSLALASSLSADPGASAEKDLGRDAANLKKHEETLGRKQASRVQDQNHMNLKEVELRGGKAKLSDDREQQNQDVERLKSVESQITAGNDRQMLDKKSYDDNVRKYGRQDPASKTAKETLRESRQALVPIRQTRRTLMTNMQKGRREVHNDKTVMGIEKRAVASDARYLAQDDAGIKKMENLIAGDRVRTADNLQRSPAPVPPAAAPVPDLK